MPKKVTEVLLALTATVTIVLAMATLGDAAQTEPTLMDCLHWRRLCDNAGDSHYLLALATLGVAT